MRCLLALIVKEGLQIVRDPSSVLIALILPLILLFIFGYGVNLDSNRLNVGIVLEDSSPEAISLLTSFSNSRFINMRRGMDRKEMEDALNRGVIRGFIVVPAYFSSRLGQENRQAPLQVIADGTEPNIASFIHQYSMGVFQIWLNHLHDETGVLIADLPVGVDARFWYNPELKSRNFLVPGSIAIIMTLIGALLTALVVSREWERGTMEALMATPISVTQILAGKLIPYFILGMGSMSVCFCIALFWYDVPFRGSFVALLSCTAVFLLAALGQGLLISSMAKDQFLASQIALLSAFLPAFMLSGFIFEIAAMPLPIRLLSYAFAVRYFVSSLQALFLAGNIWPLLWQCMTAMACIGGVFFLITSRKIVKRLD